MAIAHRATEQYAATTTATTHDFTIPASAQVDDILILCAGNRQIGNDPAQPSGWELGSIDATGAAHNLATLWRKCQAGDPGSTVTLTWPSATEAQGGIVAYSGVDTVTPMDVALAKIVANPSSNTHTAPTITPANNDTLLVHVWVSGGISPWASADAGTQRYNAIATATPRAVLYVDRPGPAAGVPSSAITATLSASAVQQATMHTLALRAAAPTGETLRPTGVSGLSNLTGSHTDIDEDPDGTITDAGLIGSDPSGTPPNITFEGSVDNTGNPTTSTSVTIPATVNDGDIILVSVVNGDGTAQPTISDNSGVGNWTDNTNGGVAKFQAGTAMAGAVFWKRITNQAVERSKVVSLGGITGSTCANLSVRRGCVASGSPIDGTPVSEGNASGNNTQAGITTLTDGAAVHVVVFYSDNTAVTTNMVATSPATITKGGEIYSSGGNDSGLAHFREIKATAGATGAFTWAPGTNQVSTSIAFALKPASSPAQTVNTQADVAMGNPVGALATGAGTGEIRSRIRKKGTGSDPQGRIELRNAAGTLLGTPVTDRAITESDANGQTANAFFNQSIILNSADVVLRFVGTGASGGLAELVAVEWNAQIATVANVDLSGTLAGGGAAWTGTLEVTDLLAGTLSGGAAWTATPESTDLLSGTVAGIGAAWTGALQVIDNLSGTISSSSSWSATLEGTDLLSGTLAGGAAWSATLESTDLLSGTLAGGGAVWTAPHPVIVPVDLAGTLAGGAAWSGALEVTDLLTGTLSGGAAWSATPQITRSLGGTLAGGATWSATPEVSRLLAGTQTGLARPWTAALEVTDLLAGTLLGGAPWGSTPLEATDALSGTVAGGGVAWQAQIEVTKSLAGTLLGGASWTATPQITRSLTGTLPGGAAWTGTPEGTDLLAGTLSGGAAWTASLGGDKLLAATLLGGASWSAALQVSRHLAGTIPAPGAAWSGGVVVTRNLAGTLAGGAVYSGLLRVERNLGGTLMGGGVPWVAAFAGFPVDFSGTMGGGASWSASLEVTRTLAGLAQGGASWGVLVSPEVTRALGGVLSPDEYHYLGSAEISRLMSGSLLGGSPYSGILGLAMTMPWEDAILFLQVAAAFGVKIEVVPAIGARVAVGEDAT
jgi:hypothetical protein